MARMYPDDIEDFEKATPGEKKVFRFLKEAARPHKNFTCWYEPPVGSTGKTPDFILFSKDLGLLVLEVKDWAIDQIIESSPFEFTIRSSDKNKKFKSPDKQAKGYVNALMDRLKEVPDFLSNAPGHNGQLGIPIGRMTVFPNIRYEDYCDRGIQWLIPSERALFKDDMAADGEILCDTSGRKFRKRISDSFPFRFQRLTQKAIEKLSFIIWPESQIDIPERKGPGKARFQREVMALDDAQSRLALRLKSGHQIIKGPPGSGKTLVLVSRCCHLFRYQPRIERILLVCFNIALVSYLKRLVQGKGVGIGDGGIQVSHFYELCSQVLEEPVRYESEDADYYELVIQEVLEKVVKDEYSFEPFDAVLVDEGQDFDNGMLKVLLGLLKLDGDLVIGLDSYQDLYKRNYSWKSLGIKAGGRTHHLKRVYRNTVEIFDFTQRFLGERPDTEKQLSLLPYDFAFHGDIPELISFRNSKEAEDFLIKDIEDVIRQEEYKKSEIAVIYDDKVYSIDQFAYDNRALPMRILRRLETSGIPVSWVSQDARAKEMFDVTTDRISLISIHSSKGLDFDRVYLVGVDHIHPTDETRHNLTSLVYVAMTRAKYRLVIPYVEESELIKRMKDCLPTWKDFTA